MNIQQVKNIHFIGIGGSGMSGLARILKAQKKIITGSDANVSASTAALKKEGFKVSIGHNAKNIPAGAEAIVYSAAIPKTNPELLEAKKRKLPVYTYTEAVGFVTQTKKTICICGTHGKTTTTAMAAAVLLAAKKDPTVIVGANIHELHNKNARCGKGEYFILESCEYQRGFLNYQPQIIIITNIEADHLDYYKNLKDYLSAFKEFIQKLPSNGLVIANVDDPNVRAVLKNFKKAKVVWYGKENLAKLKLHIPGKHNLMNATAIMTLAKELKLPALQVKKALEKYRGSSRRFEVKGKIGKTIVIDDYGHHPTEIMATLKAAREKFGRPAKILCVFQPHQYSRTHKLLNGFATAFNDANEVIIPNIFQSRDSQKDLQSVNVELLVKKISKYQPNVRDGHGLKKTLQHLKKTASHYDVIITMGAGNVYEIAESLIH